MRIFVPRIIAETWLWTDNPLQPITRLAAAARCASGAAAALADCDPRVVSKNPWIRGMVRFGSTPTMESALCSGTVR